MQMSDALVLEYLKLLAQNKGKWNKQVCVSLIKDNECGGYFERDGILKAFFLFFPPLWSTPQHPTHQL